MPKHPIKRRPRRATPKQRIAIYASSEPLMACETPDYLDSVQLGARLAMLGNGAALVYWNGDYTVSLLEPAMRNSSRRVLACGNIGKALFDRADVRLAELRKLGAVK